MCEDVLSYGVDIEVLQMEALLPEVTDWMHRVESMRRVRRRRYGREQARKAKSCEGIAKGVTIHYQLTPYMVKTPSRNIRTRPCASSKSLSLARDRQQTWDGKDLDIVRQ